MASWPYPSPYFSVLHHMTDWVGSISSKVPDAKAKPCVLELTNIHKSYGKLEVLKGIDLKLREGQVVSIVGASGSGKSTLLRCVNMLDTPEQGTLKLDGKLVCNFDLGVALTGRNLRSLRRQVGMVFQQFNLFPNMTAIENVMEGPLAVLGTPRPQAREDARALLDRVGLGDRLDSRPSQLSGGEQQRVAIARALALKPRVMLFDEVTSALDPELVGEVLTVVRDLAEKGLTMLVVTHEMDFAAQVCDDVIFIDGGIVEESGPPSQVIYNPGRERTRAFMRRILNRAG